jgi:hypothetical protein
LDDDWETGSNQIGKFIVSVNGTPNQRYVSLTGRRLTSKLSGDIWFVYTRALVRSMASR